MDLDKFRGRALAVMSLIILVSGFFVVKAQYDTQLAVLFVWTCTVCAPGITYLMTDAFTK